MDLQNIQAEGFVDEVFISDDFDLEVGKITLENINGEKHELAVMILQFTNIVDGAEARIILPMGTNAATVLENGSIGDLIKNMWMHYATEQGL